MKDTRDAHHEQPRAPIGSPLLCLLGAIAVMLLPLPAQAINGMYLTGYGFESTMLGGADVAVARDAWAANNNPAGLLQTNHRAFAFHSAMNLDVDVSQDDTTNGHEPRDDALAFYFESAYARHDADSRLALGVALVVQGGIGWTYRDLKTRLGTRDDIEAMFTVVKFTPAVAWQFTDRLRAGLALGVNYFAGGQEAFQHTACDTCLDGGPFNGFRFRGADGVALTGKLGIQYRLREDLTLAFTYGTPAHIPIEGGDLRLNLTNTPLGWVKYNRAELQGFHLPEEFSLGVAFDATPDLLLAAEYTHYRWSRALETLTVAATRPRNPLAPQQLLIPGAADFRDQHVFSAGAAYRWRPEARLYLGINYGKSPLPQRNASPVFAPISELHLMLGLERTISRTWTLAVGIEWYLPNDAHFNGNPLFGPGASVTSNNIVPQFSLTRRW